MTSDAPNILYKYVSAERGLDCIPEKGNGALRATQPSALNDPFEFMFVKAFVDDTDPQRDGELADLLSDLYPTKAVSPDDVSAARDKYGSMAERELFLGQLSQRYGIISFSSEHLHPLMWSHYTSDGSGLVIGYDINELTKTVTSIGGLIREVEYRERPTKALGNKVINRQNIPTLLLMKSSAWRYESEWRIVLQLNRTIGSGKVDPHGYPICLIEIPNPCIHVIYYTERTPSETISKIQSRIKDVDNGYQIKEMTKLILSDKEYSYQTASSQSDTSATAAHE